MTTVDKREPIEPSVDLPLSAAVEEITGFEAIGIEKRLGAKLEDLGGTSLLIGVVWVYENRGDRKVSWQDVQSRSLRALRGYFQPEPDDVDPDDPDSELGKGSEPAASTTSS